MSVAIKKVEGVETVKVSLNEGRTDITFKPGARVTVEQIRDIVLRNGFTPKGAEVKAVGTVVLHQGRTALALTGSSAVYLLAEDEKSKGKLTELKGVAKGRPVLVSGFVPETPSKATEVLTIVLREFEAVATQQ